MRPVLLASRSVASPPSLPRAGAVALALGALAPGTIESQTPKVFSACYVVATGTVYRINEPGLDAACKHDKHVGFGWTDGAGALLSGAAAGGDLGGTYPNPSVVKLRGTGVSATPPTDGQVLAYDGATSAWTPTTLPGGGASDHGALGGLADDDHPQYLLADGVRQATDGFAVTGTLGTGAIPAAGPGVRLLWYPGKAAFRAGSVAGGEWDDANVGLRSTALGQNTTASGPASTALGVNTTASGPSSTALGQATTADGSSSTAMGFNTTASGLNSTALGAGTTASGGASTALGLVTTASGQNSTAMGLSTTASGQNSTAMGRNTTASGDHSTAMGRNTTASGDHSTALGSFASTGGQEGAFVYGDRSILVEVTATAPNQVVWRAQHFWLGTNSNVSAPAGHFLTTSTGAFLSTGGTWTNNSDVSRKADFEAVDGEGILGALATLPIGTWRYQAEDPGVRHLGPTAQDFHAAFGLGQSEQAIATVDADGVALLAAQALERRTAELRAAQEALAARVRELEALREENARLRSEDEGLRGALEAVQRRLAELEARHEP